MRYLKFKWQQRYSKPQPLSSSTNTQSFGQTSQMIVLCCQYSSVRCFWLYVIIMSRTRLRVNLHSIVARMSRNSLLETWAISEVCTLQFLSKTCTWHDNISLFSLLWLWSATQYYVLQNQKKYLFLRNHLTGSDFAAKSEFAKLVGSLEICEQRGLLLSFQSCF